MTIIVKDHERESARIYCQMASHWLALGDLELMWESVHDAAKCLLFISDEAEVVYAADLDDDLELDEPGLDFAEAMMGR